MKKRYFSLLLAALVLLTSLCLPASLGGIQEAEATGEAQGKGTDSSGVLIRMGQVNTEISSDFPTGLFTVDGKVCSSHTGYSGTCSNCEVHSIYTAKKGTSYPSNTNAYTCAAFARYYFYCVFGTCSEWQAWNQQGLTASSQSSYSSMMPGDYLKLSYKATDGSSATHYVIFVSADSTGITVHNANRSAKRKIDLNEKLAYSSKYLNGTVSYIHAENYDTVNAQYQGSESNVWINSAFYQQGTTGTVLACCAMTFENAKGSKIAYTRDGVTYTGVEAVFQANGQIDSAQWRTLYNAFGITEDVFIHTAEYGTRTASQVKSLLLSKLRSNPNGILAYFKENGNSGANASCVVIIGYRDGVFYVNDPAKNVNGQGVPMTQSSLGKTLLNTTSQDTILTHIGFAETHVQRDGDRYTVSYDANGGYGAPENQIKIGGLPHILARSVPSRSSASAGSYTITLDANGGSVTSATLTAARTTSYAFTGWNTQQSGGGTAYGPESVYSADANLTLYAQWSSSTATSSVTLPTPTRSGYTFVGWGSTKTGSYTYYGAGGDRYTPTSSLTMYARWEAQECTVTFDPAGGTVSPVSKTVTVGQPYGTLPVPVREGYYFWGWVDGSQFVDEDTTVTLGTDHTLTAVWEKTILVTFDPMGGTLKEDTNTRVLTYSSPYGWLPEVTRDLYVFEGWYTAPTGGTRVLDTTPVIVNEDHTLYAHWYSNGVFLRFDYNDGERDPVLYNSPTAPFVVSEGILTTPTRTGYFFDGWYTQREGGTLVTAGMEFNENLTVYAHWSEDGPYVLINDTTFPDQNFQAYIMASLPVESRDDVGYYMTRMQVLDVKQIDVTSSSWNGIRSLTGIGYFTALQELRCDGKQLAALDVSQNTALEVLSCSENLLTELDVRSNTALKTLDCSVNQLTALDVTHNTALEQLNCGANQLTALDVTHNTQLTAMQCFNNQLISLDLSKNGVLRELSCYSNQLTALDVRGNTALERLICDDNQLSSLDVSRNTALQYLECSCNQITSLDLSTNTALTSLSCGENRLTALTVSGCTSLKELYCFSNWLATLELSEQTQLVELSCYDNMLTALHLNSAGSLVSLYVYDNQLTILDVSGYTALEQLNCNNNKLTTLNTSGCTALEQLNCNKNQLTILDVSGYTALAQLDCQENRLTTLTAAGCTALTQLDCQENRLTTLTVSGCTALEQLNCNNNKLTTLNTSGCTTLKLLDCSDNQLTALNVSGCRALERLSCDFNLLTSLSVNGCTALKYLYCDNNQLTAIDVSQNTALVNFFCYDNQLTSLNVGSNTQLAMLSCWDNQLTELNVRNCTLLVTLDCSGNQLTALDVSQNTELKGLDCSTNQLTTLDVSHNLKLERLYCSGNRLTQMAVGGNTALEALRCENNLLTALDVSKNTDLFDLWCSGNQLTGLDVSHNTKLDWLKCDNNRITTLDLRANPRMIALSVKNNGMTQLLLPNLTGICTFAISGNHLPEIDLSGSTLDDGPEEEPPHLIDLSGQTIDGQTLQQDGTHCSFDMTQLVAHPERVTVVTDRTEYDPTTGIVTFLTPLTSFAYTYATGHGDLEVTVHVVLSDAEIDSGTCGAQGDNLTWSLAANGMLTIRGSGAMEEFDDCWQAPWVQYDHYITGVVITEGVTSIGQYSFETFLSLTSVTLPESLTHIGYHSFNDCRKLESIHIPAGVRSIGIDAFAFCLGLTDFTVSSENRSFCAIDGAVYSKDGKTLVLYPCGRTTAIFAPGVTCIGDSAFSGCKKLTAIDIPATVTRIGSYAFGSCDGLTYIDIPSGVTSIGSFAFNGCDELTAITIPASVTSIGGGAFNCGKLTSIQVAQGNRSFASVDGVLFSYNRKELVAYPQGKARLEGSYAIPSGVTRVGSYAFYFCSGLTSVTIPSGVTSIDSHAFAYCTKLTAMDIPSSVTVIGDYAFNQCRALDSITIPVGVTTIGNYAFEACIKLTSVTMPSTITNIGRGAYSDCVELVSVTLPSGLTEIPVSMFFECFKLSSVVIPASVTSIGNGSFYACRDLTFVSIPSAVVSIGEYAFEASGVTDVYYRGTPEQRDGIRIGRMNEPLVNAVWHYDPVALPTITDQPEDVTVQSGSRASFSVKAAEPYATFQWFARAGEDGEWTSLAGETGDELTVVGSAANNGWQYRCRVQNPLGGTVYSTAATLTVLLKVPEIKTQPKDVTVKSGSKVKFAVKASGKNLSYQWFGRSAGAEDWTELAGETKNKLTVAATLLIDGSEYFCRVSNADGAVDSVAAVLHVTAQPPVIKTQPRDMAAKSGAKAKFAVKASGPNLRYTWYTRASADDPWIEIDGADRAEYSVTASMAKNGSQYYCKVWNTDGSEDSAAATLTVTYVAIVLKAQPADVTVKSGAKARFTVKASGPNLQYAWFRRANPEDPWTEIDGASKAEYSFTPSQAYDGYQYRCRIWNDDESLITAEATLTVTPQPPAIKTSPKNTTVKSETKAKLKVSASGSNLRYQWFERASEDEGWTAIDGAVKAEYAFTAKLAQNGHQFYCRVENDDGAVDSAVATLTVTPQPPKFSTQPKDAKVKPGTEAKFKVKASGAGVTYQWYYRTSEDGEWILMEGETDAILIVLAAEGNNGYQYRCRAENVDGATYSKAATLKLK